MFKSITNFKFTPQAIGLPFLSTQEDAQLKFKSGEAGVKRLYSDQVGLHHEAVETVWGGVHRCSVRHQRVIAWAVSFGQRQEAMRRRAQLTPGHTVIRCRVLEPILQGVRQRGRRLLIDHGSGW